MRMIRLVIFLLICIFLFFSISYAQKQHKPSYKKTLLVKLKPKFSKEEVKQIASEYGCNIGKIHRFNYDDSPHITVKFFIQDKEKTPLDIIFKAEDDKRIISLTPDMKGKRFSSTSALTSNSSGGSLGLTNASCSKIREAIIETNRDMLETMGWFRADKYFKNHYEGPVRKDGIDTIIITLDTGIVEDSWVRETGYLFQGGDMVKKDKDPTDYEDVEFKYRHGEMMTQEIFTLTPNTGLLPIRTSLSGEGPTISEMKLALEKTYAYIKNSGKDYNIVLNITTAFSKAMLPVSMRLSMYWKGKYGKSKLFPLFKQQCKQKLKEAGYNPEELQYSDIFKKDKQGAGGLSVKDEQLYDMATSWLFKSIYVSGSLSPKLKVKEGGGWEILQKMEEDGWMINGPGGNTQGEILYPSALPEVEAIDGAEAKKGFAYPISPQGDWTGLAAPRRFKVYNHQKDTFYEAVGTCGSAAFVSSLEARLWNLSPNLEKSELEKIVKNTTTEIKGLVLENAPAPSKELVHPYRAMRVAYVYGEIKEIFNNISEIKSDEMLTTKINNALNDVKDGEDFTGRTEEVKNIFYNSKLFQKFTQETKNIISHPLNEILNVIVEHSKKIISEVGESEILDGQEKKMESQSQQDYLQINGNMIPSNSTVDTQFPPFSSSTIQ